MHNCTKFKNGTAQRFKLLKTVLHTFRRRWILTGTPAPNGLLDLFGQQYIVDMGRALGAYITHYRQRWFSPSGFGGYDWKIRDDRAAQEIHNALKPTTLRLDEADYLTLPPVRDNFIRVELPEKAREQYERMEEEMLAEVEDAGERYLVMAVSNGVAQGKCRQIASGALYVSAAGDDRDGTFGLIHDAKLDALEDLIEERQGQPMIVLYQFRHELVRAVERLGVRNAPYIGKSTREDAVLCEAWNAGKLPVLLAHPGSIGHGLNLQHGGNALCWLSQTWNAEEQDQVIRRLKRRGSQHEFIIQHHIVAVDTIDELMVSVTRAKRRDQKSLLDALRSYRAAKVA